MDSNTIIVLLTVITILLSVVILALLVAVVLVLIKVNKIAKSVDSVTHNFAEASAWLSPAKLFSEVVKAFKK